MLAAENLTLQPEPPPGARADWTIDQAWDDYTEAEHAVWDRLFARQSALLPDRASPRFLAGLEVLKLGRPGVPRFEALSERLAGLTGWSVVAVPGLVPDAVFFDHLAQRRFVAGRFIRRPDQLDYLQEPDVFHDLFGHVPLLADPEFADYLQAYGEGGLRSLSLGALHRLARLYWRTVEFGLVSEPEGLRIYGAGILSSHGEALYALEDPAPARIAFDLRRVMRTRYRIDDFQQVYFVIHSFEDLLRQTIETDFAPLYVELEGLPDIAPDTLAPGDRLVEAG
ncbi:MAG: phenylalanine 4-monooxygenase [Caulobacteraceae bacterium]|nr:phenylalanine 4-monooxygenase [Caulobacteraceae bacterium]